MKFTNKYIAFASAALMLVSCDLDKLPDGQYVTEKQKDETNDKRPNMVIAEVNGMAAKMNCFGTISDDVNEYHSDFGVPAVSLQLESCGQDFVATTSGYNWFNRAQNYSDRVYTDKTGAEFIWKIFYNHMQAANNVLLSAPKDSDDPDLKIYRGQALASRAYDYLNLVQCFQFTYAGHENALAVPIVTETMTTEELESNPRATVQQVYDQIMNDLNEAIELLDGYVHGAANKDKIDIHVAYGLRARANLLMQKWADAAKDAEMAMAGGSPQSLKDVSSPTFNSSTVSSWLWGIVITPDNEVVTTGIVNWPSHLCSFTGNGYTTLTGAFRFGSSSLYELIPATDIRKQWFVSPEKTSTLIDNETVGGESVIDYFGLSPYVNTKFGAYQNTFGNSTNSSDWPLMRVEEMILIKAEGEAMSGNLTAGKATLEDFVKTYRDPSFASKATSPQDLQDEVWLQRRMELWGEGFSLFDILRLKKPIVRKGSNFAASVQFDLAPESQIMIYRVPQCEMEANQGIEESDNNPAAPQPTL
ncbi:RagB/SusD family nutrient uptake outer membrane protein [uncultured Parabacteroides sp.]|uniref:RagB/SusD family nutrient uptake outer membrane protein n=1 Tax=uncultured Parabacteroides sp. TaxID=512312 RepID=UPI002593077B|nr:RagB/SusD family nutrient uptake outer membrane protein [uncultured Parabacteroides sp.]